MLEDLPDSIKRPMEGKDMKNFVGKFKLAVIAGAVLLVLPTLGQALPWQVNDDLKIQLVSGYSVDSKITGWGGLFKLENTTRGETVYGFCVELDEWLLSPSKVYDADDDVAVLGGRNTNDGDELSGATQWLYWKYLTDPAYYPTTDAVKALQLAIWYLEDEYYDKPNKGATLEQWREWYGGPLAATAYNYILEAQNHNNFTSDQILALDVYDGGTNQKQSYIYHVPEPLTLTMLGLGLVGFAIATRLKMRKPR